MTQHHFAGLAARETVKTWPPVAPWHAVVSIDALGLFPARKFEVLMNWTGPPAVGFPPSDKPVAGTDVYVTDSLEHARAIALRAHELLAQGGDRPPDLRELAAIFRSGASNGRP